MELSYPKSEFRNLCSAFHTGEVSSNLVLRTQNRGFNPRQIADRVPHTSTVFKLVVGSSSGGSSNSSSSSSSSSRRPPPYQLCWLIFPLPELWGEGGGGGGGG